MEMNYSASELRRIEQEVGVELLPGTEIMTDLDSHHFVKSTGSKHQVLVPQPSDDPSDPLNWSISWKIACITAATVMTFSQGVGPLALAPMFPYYIEEWNRSLDDCIQFTSVCILVLGFSNFIWVPISTSIGRRPVYIISQLICIGSSIWRARAQSYESFMGACVLNGIGAGPAETVQPAVIADIFFLHDRGKWNTLYWVVYVGAIQVGPTISGSMSQRTGWRNFWWLNTGILCLGFILAVFFFPETKWHRPQMVLDDVSRLRDASPPDTVGDEDPEKINHLRAQAEQQEKHTSDELKRVVTASDPWLGKGKPSWNQFGLYHPGPNPLKSAVMDIWIPLKLFSFPIIQFASLLVAFTSGVALTINLTQSQHFAGPPYNISSENIGFTNLAILAGCLIGLFTAGPLSDWVSARATARNNGIREPEMRLPAMIPYVLVMILCNIIVAIGYERNWPWEPIVIIGYTCSGIIATSTPSIVSTYAVDSYKPVAASLFVSITVYKNVWGYGVGKFLTPWILAAGYYPPFFINMAITTAFSLLGFVFYFKGKTFRQWTKNSGIHKL